MAHVTVNFRRKQSVTSLKTREEKKYVHFCLFFFLSFFSLFLSFYFFIFETRYYSAALAILELTEMYMPLPSETWIEGMHQHDLPSSYFSHSKNIKCNKKFLIH